MRRPANSKKPYASRFIPAGIFAVNINVDKFLWRRRLKNGIDSIGRRRGT